MNPNSLVKEIQRKKTEELRTVMDDIYQQVASPDVVRGKLPESIFVEQFLPRFIGEIPISATDLTFKFWLSISGGPGNPVDILDTEGNVLFTVPPLLDTSMLDIEGGEISLAAMLSQYDAYASRGLYEGDRYLQSVLGNRIQESIQNGELDNVNSWASILTRYGKLEQMNNNVTTTVYDDGGDDLLLDEYE